MYHLRAQLGFKKRGLRYFKSAVLGPRLLSNKFYEIRLSLGLTSRKRKGNSNLVSLNLSEMNQDSVDKL